MKFDNKLLILLLLVLSGGLITFLVLNQRKHITPKPPIPPVPTPPQPTPVQKECERIGDRCANGNFCDDVGKCSTQIKVDKDLKYGNNESEILNLYYPPLGNGKSIILVHGGGMIKGSKDNEREVNMALDLAYTGYHVFAINYSIGKGSYPQDTKDIIDAVNYVKTNYTELSKNLSIIGLSAGSTVMLLTVIKNNMVDDIKNVVSFYGITDPLQRIYLEDTERHNAGEFRGGHMEEVLGTTRCVSCKSDIPHYTDKRYCQDTNYETLKLHCVSNVWRDASPLENLSTQTVLPNVILVHGRVDNIVNYEQSLIFYNALKKLGFPVHIIPVKNGMHGFDFQKNVDGTQLNPNNLLDSVIKNMK